MFQLCFRLSTIRPPSGSDDTNGPFHGKSLPIPSNVIMLPPSTSTADIAKRTVQSITQSMMLSSPLRSSTTAIRAYTTAERHRRVDVCGKLLDYYKNDNTVLNRIITGDSLFIHGKGLSPKIMITLFWDIRGPLLLNFEPRLPEPFVTQPKPYNEILRELRNNINKNRSTLKLKHNRHKWVKAIADQGKGRLLLLHDNNRLHMDDKDMSDTLEHCNFINMMHPSHSSDLFPNNYYILPQLNQYLKSRPFRDDGVLIMSVSEWIDHKTDDWFENGINQLPRRWQKVIDANGGPIENM